LQEGVPDCIASLALAGIKIWVLTGDKVETGINIGRSCKLLTPLMENRGLLKIDLSDKMADDEARQLTASLVDKYLEMTKEDGSGTTSLGLVCSGRALDFVFPSNAKTNSIVAKKTELEQKFLKLCNRCAAVMCCRVSPAQKAQVVNMVKRGVKGSITLGIGDGANDVAMIQTAHIGIGISGFEGLQAVMASDYAIAQFRFLKKLLLVHGSWNYQRTATLILYSFYKNVAIAFTQVIFSYYCGASGQMYYDSWVGTSFNVIFVAFPIISLAVFNKPVSKECLMKYPQLYKPNQKDYHFNMWVFFWYVILGFYHSFLVFYMAQFTFNDIPDSNGRIDDLWVESNAMYTYLVFLVSFKCALETTTYNWITVTIMALSILAWFITMGLFYVWWLNPIVIGVGPRLLGSPRLYLGILMTLVLGMAPDIIYKYVQRMYFYRSEDIVKEVDKFGEYVDIEPTDSFSKQRKGTKVHPTE